MYSNLNSSINSNTRNRNNSINNSNNIINNNVEINQENDFKSKRRDRNKFHSEMNKNSEFFKRNSLSLVSNNKENFNYSQSDNNNIYSHKNLNTYSKPMINSSINNSNSKYGNKNIKSYNVNGIHYKNQDENKIFDADEDLLLKKNNNNNDSILNSRSKQSNKNMNLLNTNSKNSINNMNNLILEMPDENLNSVNTLDSRLDDKNFNEIQTLNFEFTDKTNLNENLSNINFDKIKFFENTMSEIANNSQSQSQYGYIPEVKVISANRNLDSNNSIPQLANKNNLAKQESNLSDNTNSSNNIHNNTENVKPSRNEANNKIYDINNINENENENFEFTENERNQNNLDYESYIRNNFRNSNTFESEQLKELKRIDTNTNNNPSLNPNFIVNTNLTTSNQNTNSKANHLNFMGSSLVQKTDNNYNETYNEVNTENDYIDPNDVNKENNLNLILERKAEYDFEDFNEYNQNEYYESENNIDNQDPHNEYNYRNEDEYNPYNEHYKNFEDHQNDSDSAQKLGINPIINSYSFTNNQTPNFLNSKGKFPINNSLTGNNKYINANNHNAPTTNNLNKNLNKIFNSNILQHQSSRDSDLNEYVNPIYVHISNNKLGNIPSLSKSNNFNNMTFNNHHMNTSNNISNSVNNSRQNFKFSGEGIYNENTNNNNLIYDISRVPIRQGFKDSNNNTNNKMSNFPKSVANNNMSNKNYNIINIKEDESVSRTSNTFENNESTMNKLRNQQYDSKNYSLNYAENQLLTLKGAEYLDTLQNKTDFSAVTFNNNNKTKENTKYENSNVNTNTTNENGSNKNLSSKIFNLNDDVYNMPLQQKNKNYAIGVSKVNESYLKDVEAIKKPKVKNIFAEKFVDFNIKPLAVFFSSKNDISLHLNDKSRFNDTIEKGNSNYNPHQNNNPNHQNNNNFNNNFSLNQNNILNDNINFYETFNSDGEVVNINNNTFLSSNNDKKVKYFSRSIRSKKISFDKNAVNAKDTSHANYNYHHKKTGSLNVSADIILKPFNYYIDICYIIELFFYSLLNLINNIFIEIRTGK